MPQEQLKILLIEHDPGFARYVGEMLGQARDLTAEMRPAADLAAGLSELQAKAFDAVLLDIYLPDGAGLANIPLIKAQAPQVPIIAVGDSDDEIVALEAVHAGAQDYLVKSQLTPAWLERSIRYAIERHRMDLALLEAEEKYHSVFDHLVEGIFQTTPDGRYLMANAALARIYGYASPEELIQGLTDIGGRLYVEEGRREEFIRLMQEHDTITGFESPIYRKDGSVIWISENCRAIRDARGRLLYYEGTVEDITQRRQAEENLRNSEALYHSLVETLPQNILRKDLQGRFTFANQQFCKILGRPLEEIVGKTDFDFFPRELAEKYQRDDRRVMQTGKPYETVEEHQPPGRDKIYVQVVKTPLYGADGAHHWAARHLLGHHRSSGWRTRRSAASTPCWPKAARNCAPGTRRWKMTCKMAREIQLTMLPQQYPTFPRSALPSESAFQFTHRYLPAGTCGRRFLRRLRAFRERSGRVHLRCRRARRPLGAGDGHDPRAGGGAQTAGHGPRTVPEQAQLRPPRHPQTHRHADADHGVLPGGGLDDGRGCATPTPAIPNRCISAAAPARSSRWPMPAGKSQPVLGLFEDAAYQTSEVKLESRRRGHAVHRRPVRSPGPQ